MKQPHLVLGISLACLFALSSAALAGGNGRASSAGEEASPRAVIVGTCTGMTTVRYKSDTSIDGSTASNVFVSVPNATVAFNQGGSGNGCAIVTFSAESYAEFGRLIQVRARLDDAETAQPGIIQFSGDDDEDGDGRWARSRSYTFIFPVVPAGPHSVSIQFRSQSPGGRVYIGRHTTVVQHR